MSADMVVSPWATWSVTEFAQVKAFIGKWTLVPTQWDLYREQCRSLKLLKDAHVCVLVAQSCLTLCDHMDCSTPDSLSIINSWSLLKTHVHRVGDAIQPSHPLLSPSPPTLNLSQHHSLIQWVSSSHQVAKVLEFQHQSFQWIFRTDSFRMDWLDLLVVQGTLKNLQHHSSKASVSELRLKFTLAWWVSPCPSVPLSCSHSACWFVRAPGEIPPERQWTESQRSGAACPKLRGLTVAEPCYPFWLLGMVVKGTPADFFFLVFFFNTGIFKNIIMK